MDTFRKIFPKHSDSQALKTLEKRLEEVQTDVKDAEEKQHRYNNRFEPNSNPDSSGALFIEKVAITGFYFYFISIVKIVKQG